jgi:hypothetical protein
MIAAILYLCYVEKIDISSFLNKKRKVNQVFPSEQHYNDTLDSYYHMGPDFGDDLRVGRTKKKSLEDSVDDPPPPTTRQRMSLFGTNKVMPVINYADIQRFVLSDMNSITK